MQIMAEHNLEEKWVKCVNLAFNRLNITNLGEVANKKQTLNRLMQEYIIKPSLIRNKVTHGQWIYCLNSDCTKINQNTITQIGNLDFVKIERYFCIFRDYYQIIAELKDYIESTKSWSLETKKHKILSSIKYQNYKEKYYKNGAY